MRRILLFLSLLLLVPRFSPARAQSPGRDLTLMIYLCGSDLESEFGTATAELDEIRNAVAGNPSVTVLAMLGGSTGWSAGYPPDQTAILEIGRRGIRLLQSMDAMNMGRAETLTALLQYGVENHPASRYALILWNHGAGPMAGVCFDEQNSMDSLSLSELAAALEASPFSPDNPLAWIGFDACLMASLETALSVSPYARYMIASQETEPASGWNYAFLGSAGPDVSDLEMCRRAVEAYTADKPETDLLTLSLIDLEKVPALAGKVDSLFRNLSPQLTRESFSRFSHVRRDTKSFGRIATGGSDYDLADLYDLAERFRADAQDQAEDVMQALEKAVIAAAGNQSGANGLSVYYPFYNKKAFRQEWNQTLDAVSGLPEYVRFLKGFCDIWTGEQLTRWGHLSGAAVRPPESDVHRLEMTLTDEQAAHFDSAYCLILEDAGSDDAYWNIYNIGSVSLEGNTLRAEYPPEALFAVDENGNPLTPAIPFIYHDGMVLIGAWLQRESMLSFAYGDLQFVWLVCSPNHDSGELEIRFAVPVRDSDTDALGKYDLQLLSQAWPFIRFEAFAQRADYEEDGSLKAFPLWPDTPESMLSLDAIDPDGNRISYFEWTDQYDHLPQGWRHEMEVDCTRPWKLKFCPKQSNGKNLAAQFIVRDTQGNEWGSGLIPLHPSDVLGSAVLNGSAKRMEGCYVEPLSAAAIMNDSFQGICLRLRITNRTGSNMNPGIIDPYLNGISAPEGMKMIYSDMLIRPGETRVADFYLDLSFLPYRDDPVLRTVSFSALTEDDSEIFLTNRTALTTELDLSGLPLPERPGKKLSAENDARNCSFQLLDLEKDENDSLSGILHISNDGDTPQWISLMQGAHDDKPLGTLNGIFLHSLIACDIGAAVLIEKEGELYLPFTISPDQNHELTIFKGISSDLSELSAEDLKVREISRLGFAVHWLGPELEEMFGSDYSLVELQLTDPVQLDDPYLFIHE